MAENLNYNASDSKCYNNSEANCVKYGRLYNWATAMVLPASCNSSFCASQVGTKHRGICPSGWHIPSNEDWNVLMKFANPNCSDNSNCAGAGTKLKATSGWNYYPDPNSGNGTDDYGFSALPGGSGYSGSDYFGYVGEQGQWWSSSESNINGGTGASTIRMTKGNDVDNCNSCGKDALFSVRCVKD